MAEHSPRPVIHHDGQVGVFTMTKQLLGVICKSFGKGKVLDVVSRVEASLGV